MKEVNDINKWRDIPCPLTEKFKMTKMSIFPKLIYISIQYQAKSPQNIFCRNQQADSKISMARQRKQNKIILEKKKDKT